MGLSRTYVTKLERKMNPALRNKAKAGAQKTLRIKKKAPPKPTGKPPAPGERKAWRKRVVLSNTNALEVEMREFDGALVEEWGREEEGEEMVLQGALALGNDGEGAEGVVGQVVGLLGETVDSLRAVEAFKTTQGWGLFRRPGLLVREESVVVSRKLVQAERETLRLVIDGERGTGKSLLLLHAMATAFVRGWIVLNIPEGILPIFIVKSWKPMLTIHKHKKSPTQ
jgi:small subunit ribosomal protein S29